MWRWDSRITPKRWSHDGPDPREQLNPFLPARSSFVDPRPEPPLPDPLASALVESAIQAETLPGWWDPVTLVERYERLRTLSEPYLQAWSERYEGDFRELFEPRLEHEWSEALPDLLDRHEVAMTRLLLIGHPPTTRSLLPPLLGVMAEQADGPVWELVRVTELAMGRLPLARRLATGTRVSFRLLGNLQNLRTDPESELYPGDRLALAATVAIGTGRGRRRTAATKAPSHVETTRQPLDQ